MLIIPAIDLKNGKCVRLRQGDPDQETIYSGDPVAVAQDWVDAGAELIHIIDLDGAFTGRSHHLEIIKAIAEGTGARLQVGGGMRSREIIEAVFEAGAERVILGTIAWEDPAFVGQCVQAFGPRVLVGIDARDGYVAVKGWQESTSVTAVELARRMQDLGVEEVIVTDIARDGMLTGPNVASIEEILALGLKVIAAGGIASLDDLKKLAALKHPNLTGVISGKALYAGAFTLEEAIALTKEMA
ncbi:MAG: 1-(5-phosphoribosyl)-5-[(5-phosphoribosylamino)methylideneamino]imidazole-4-carboxamide isomerase [Limnochordia bacterium]|jgi:phosphoribosylformimino-5-aminoimidazole carboxamide ribotide isomerase